MATHVLRINARGPRAKEFRVERVYTAWMHAVMSWGFLGLLLALSAGLAAPRGWLGVGGGLLAAALLWIGLRRQTIGFESVLVTQLVGIQLTTHFRSGAERTRFVEWTSVKSVFINEAVDSTAAYFYLAMALHGSERLVVLFPGLRPRYSMLHTVYNDIQDMFDEHSTASTPGASTPVVASDSLCVR